MLLCTASCLQVNAESTAAVPGELPQTFSTASYYSQYLEAHTGGSAVLEEITLLGREAVGLTGDATISAAHPGESGATLLMPQGSEASWTVTAKHSGLYAMAIRYLPAEGNGGTIERVLLVDGTLPYREAESS